MSAAAKPAPAMFRDLRMALILECVFQRYQTGQGWPVSRQWVAESVAIGHAVSATLNDRS
jgi:hypothetical protein